MWIIVGWYNDDWWKKQDVKCQGEQLIEAAANMIETLPLPLSTSKKPTVSSRVSKVDFLGKRYEIQRECGENGNKICFSGFGCISPFPSLVMVCAMKFA